jgi:predicted lipoprotein
MGGFTRKTHIMRKFIYAVLMAASVAVVIQACSKSGDPGKGPDTGNNNFDRKALLTNISTNIIIPAYTTYQADVTAFSDAVTAFTAAPDNAKLVVVQNTFSATYLQWQATSAFEFGPAADVSLRVNTNTYPTDVTQINSNVTAGTYNPNLLANISAKGLPALDYLLFGTGADNNAIIVQYTTDGKAANRKSILTALTAELKENADAVASAWNGTYKNTFINATGTDVGSSLGLMVNQLVYDYEVLKNFEIGIPSGVQSLGTAFPQKVQAYYSKKSVALTLAHIRALQTLYTGKDGIGLDDYLVAVNAKSSTGATLNDVIKAQFAAGATKIQTTLTDPLSAQISSNPAPVVAAYTELQKLTALLKTDMTSSLGILITYGDNDGD